MDGKTGDIAGHVIGLSGSHGVAIDFSAGEGYADSGKSQTVSIFDLKTLKIIKTIPALLDADGMAFDASTDQVFIAGGDAHAVRAVDAHINEPGKIIDLAGSPEFLVRNRAGSLFVNIKNENEIVKINARTDSIVSRWPVASCVGPTGLAIDVASHRLFSTCENAVMAIIDSDNGKLLASLPIGRGTDAAAFDPQSNLAFSSNCDGTLSVVHELGPDHFVKMADVATEPGARTMTINPATGQVFLVTARVQSAGAPKYHGGPPSYKFIPGTLKLLVYTPAFKT